MREEQTENDFISSSVFLFFCISGFFIALSLPRSPLQQHFYSKLLVRVQRRPRRRESRGRSAARLLRRQPLRLRRILGPPLARPRLFRRRRWRWLSAPSSARSSSAHSSSAHSSCRRQRCRRPQGQLRRRSVRGSGGGRGGDGGRPLVLRQPPGRALEVAPLVLQVDLRAALVEAAGPLRMDQRPLPDADPADQLAEAGDLVVGPGGRGPAGGCRLRPRPAAGAGRTPGASARIAPRSPPPCAAPPAPAAPRPSGPGPGPRP